MEKPEFKVSVVICAYTLDRLADVHDAVKSALLQTLRPHQVIVSVDHNRELLEKLREELPAGVKLVSNDGIKGLSETRNAGIRCASGDVIAFIDDDATADMNWLKRLGRHFRDKRVAAAGGRIVPKWLDGGRPTWFPEEIDWIVGCTYAGMPLRGNVVRNLIGCNMAFRASVFTSVGLFNTDVGRTDKTNGIGEDSEICLRISRCHPGALIVHEPDAVVCHKVPHWRVKPGYILKRAYDEGLNKSKVRALCSRSAQPLSTESTYLHYLFFNSVPRRLQRIYRKESILQLGTILACVMATGTGYWHGRLKKRSAVSVEKKKLLAVEKANAR